MEVERGEGNRILAMKAEGRLAGGGTSKEGREQNRNGNGMRIRQKYNDVDLKTVRILHKINVFGVIHQKN